jgi:hypothetical protein
MRGARLALTVTGVLALIASASPATAPATPGAPQNTSPPMIAGIAQQAQTLSVVHGAWTNSPTSYSYQWLQCDSSGSGCATIAGATGQTYVPSAVDVGRALSVNETAANAEGSSTPASSSPTRAIVARAEWRLEQPEAPPPPPGVERATAKVGLGKIGDIEFIRPNLGLLITAGNPPTIPPGVWAYDGVSWRPLTGEGPSGKGVCGATDGRIAWAFAGVNEAGEEEFDFWTVSDGRPGQVTEHGAPLEDNTLCHFKGSVSTPGQVVGSYGSLAFQPTSYQAMHAAGCLSQNDCWFAGNPLPSSNRNPGAFHLHWNGNAVEETPNPQGHAVEDMRAFELQAPPAEAPGALPPRYLFESVQLASTDKVTEQENPGSPSLLHLITPIGAQPTFLSLTPGVPLYGETELPTALGFLHLGADESALWGAADPTSLGNPEGAEVTIVRDTATGTWSQLVGPNTDPATGNPFTKFPNPKKLEEERANEVVTSIAPDHFGESAWVALTSRENASLGSAAPALLARVTAPGAIAERVALPSIVETAQGVRPKGAADKLSCPALNDCWLATSTGWLFHLSDGTALGRDAAFDQAFAGLINFRPLDAGVPQVQPDQPPPDESGQPHATQPSETFAESTTAASQTSVAVALLSHVRTRLVHGTTLELTFHLAARARVRLVARRHRRIVASTAMRTFAAGNRKLLLLLNVKNWPTKLDLQTHALETLPTVSIRGAATTTVGTSLTVLPRTPPFSGSGSLP